MMTGIIALVIAIGGGFVGFAIGNIIAVAEIAVIASITAIVAIIKGAIANKDPNQKGAKAGLIMGIIALSFAIISIIAGLGLLVLSGSRTLFW